MLLAPELTVEFQDVQGGMFGLVSQPAWWCGDDMATLTGQQGAKLDGVMFEKNTNAVILTPTMRYHDLSVANTTQSGTGALWRDTLDRATGSRILTQYSSVADVAWAVTTNLGTAIEADEYGFAVDLYLGAPPKDTTTRDSTGIFRQVSWPGAPATGENQYRVTISYETMPYIEISTDGGSTFTKLADLEGSIDPDAIRKARNLRLTLSVMVIDSEMVVWLGQELKQFAYVYRQGLSGTATKVYKAGEVKITGKGGLTSIGFAKIRYGNKALTGSFASYLHPGPRDMTTPTHHVLPRGPNPLPAGQTITGSIVSTDPVLFFFSYRVALAGPAAPGGDSSWAKETPWVKEVSIVFEAIETAPVTTGWTARLLTGDQAQYWQRVFFDPAARVLRRENRITVRAYGGEYQPLFGVQAVRVHSGYAHERLLGIPATLQGHFVQNTDAFPEAAGRDATIAFIGADHVWNLGKQYLKRDAYPSRWCVYAAVRLALSAGGIVSDYWQTLPKNDLGSDFCDFGPDPAHCSHTKMPVRPGYPALTPVLDVLDDIQAVEFAWYGTTADNQFHFEPFNAQSYNQIGFALTEQGTPPDPSLGGGYSELGGPAGGTLRRIRSLAGVKTDISMIGVDQTTNAIIQSHYRDDNAINVRTAPNFVGAIVPWAVASATLVDQAYLDRAVQSAAAWARLPYEGAVIPSAMLPFAFPTPEWGKLVTAQEQRILGPGPVPYMVLAVEFGIDAPGRPWSLMTALWPGIGMPPGNAQAGARPPGPIHGGDVGAIPPWARSGNGTVNATGPGPG